MIHYDAMPDQEHVLDEAYLDALEQKVTILLFSVSYTILKNLVQMFTALNQIINQAIFCAQQQRYSHFFLFPMVS